VSTAATSMRFSLVHQVLFYDSVDEFLAAVVPFVLEGLRRREALLAVTGPANADALRRSLGAGADYVEFVDAISWYDAPGRTLAAYHRYVTDRAEYNRRIRVVGEPVWTGRDELETAEWTRCESVLNVTLAGTPTWVICPYNRRDLPAAVVADALRTHPELVTRSGRQSSSGYADPAAFHAEHRPPFGTAPEAGCEWRTFAADPRPVREFAALFARRAGLAPGRIDDLMVAVNEVTTNAIKHGAGFGEIRIWVAHGRLVCQISDPGHTDSQFLGYLPGDPDADHGHGLWLVRQLADLMEIDTGRHGTTVRLSMRLT
jgi:anti-sigma regulatory factor (Ser/Thr protein kinase)